KAIENAATTEEAQEIWDELQLYAWEELLPIIQLGGFHALYAQSSNVSEVTTSNGPIFWNVTISE
ncbi:MAG TPA: peptide ABC transporter substrate-binding protein, partial [Bacillota bacterium]|nr:peptide ABC transporter substrate-binding protein [Bacillota bacterium]